MPIVTFWFADALHVLPESMLVSCYYSIIFILIGTRWHKYECCL